MADTSPTAELLVELWGDNPRPRIYGALYDADDYLNRTEIARRGGFDRSTLYRGTHLDDIEELGLVDVIRKGDSPHYRLTDDGVDQLDKTVNWARTVTNE